MREKIAASVLGILGISVLGAIVGGWIANIYKLLTCSLPFVELTVVEVLRVVGVFVTPVGVVMGFI